MLFAKTLEWDFFKAYFYVSATYLIQYELADVIVPVFWVLYTTYDVVHD